MFQDILINFAFRSNLKATVLPIQQVAQSVYNLDHMLVPGMDGTIIVIVLA